MKINNFREYINLPEYKQEEIQGFITKVEDFAKSMLPRMDEHIKAILDVSILVGRGASATICFYGYNEMYDDQFDFERVNTRESMERQVGGIVRSFIGEYDSIYASTFWTAKRRYGKGNSAIETGPYVEVEFYEDTIYKLLGESVRNLTDRILEGKNVRSAIQSSVNRIIENDSTEELVDVYVYIDSLKKWELLYSQIPEKVASDIWSAGFKTGENKISISTNRDKEVERSNRKTLGKLV